MVLDKFSHQNLCDSCNSKSCCTSDPPLVFSNDIQKIEKIIKHSIQFYEKKNMGNFKVNILKKKENSKECFFLDSKKNQCSIYDHRPFDCKMFPFDIVKFKHEYYWTVFSCNKQANWDWTEEHLIKLESDPQFLDVIKNIDHYASYLISNFDNNSTTPFTVIRPIKFCLEKILFTEKSKSHNSELFTKFISSR